MKKEVLVVGDLILDKYLSGNCSRISPEAPIQIVHKQNENFIIGGAGNVAMNLSSIGLNCTLFSMVGKDSSCEKIKEIISRNDNLEFFPFESDRVTTQKTRIVVNGQQLLRVDDEEIHDISEKEVLTITKKIDDLLSTNNFQLVILSDYRKGFLTEGLFQNIIKLCKKYEIETFLDPKSKNFNIYNGVSLIKPNEKEAVESCSFEIQGISINDDNLLIKVALDIKKSTNAKFVLLTLSSQGSVLIDTKSLKIFKAHSTKVDVFDVTGAGDTFLSVFSYFHMNGHDLSECLTLANKASSISVSKRGNYIVTKGDILFIQNGN